MSGLPPLEQHKVHTSWCTGKKCRGARGNRGTRQIYQKMRLAQCLRDQKLAQILFGGAAPAEEPGPVEGPSFTIQLLERCSCPGTPTHSRRRRRRTQRSHRRCEEEGLSLLLRRTPRQCEEEGRRCQSFLLRSTQRNRRCTRRGCEEEGQRAIPLPPKKPRLTLGWLLDLGVESLSPHPQGNTQPSNAQPNKSIKTSRTVREIPMRLTRRENRDASNHPGLCDSRHHRS